MTVPPEVARSASKAFRIGWTAIVLAVVSFRGWTVSQWSWFQDDWVYLEKTQELGFWEYLFQGYNSHLMPAVFLIVRVSTDVAPLDHTTTVITTMLFAGTALIAWGLLLRELFGERLRILVVLTVIGLTPSLTSVSLWWAAALQIYPLQTCMALTLYFLVRWLRHGKRRDLAFHLIAYLVGLAFWEKALLITVPMAFLAMAVADGRPLVRMRRAARAVAPAAMLSVAYLLLYLTIDVGESFGPRREEPQSRSLGQAIEFLWHGLVDLLLPAMVGGPLDTIPVVDAKYAAPATVQVLALVVLASVIVFRGLRARFHVAAIALTMALTYVGISWGLVLFSDRYDALGLVATRDGRYIADIMPVMLLAVLLLTTDLVGQPASRAGHRGRGLFSSVKTRSLWRTATQCCLAAIVVLSVVNTLRAWDGVRESSPGPFVDNLVADASRVGTATVYDSAAPGHVIHPIFFFGRGNVSDLLAPKGLPLIFNQPTPTFLVVDEEGLFRIGEVVNPANKSAEPPPVPDCGYLLEPGTTSTVPMTGVTYDFEWIVQLEYFTGESAPVRIVTGESEAELTLPATEAGSLSRMQFVAVDKVGDLTITVDDSAAPICLIEVTVGRLTPGDRPAPSTTTP
jgi:hypothetical protein